MRADAALNAVDMTTFYSPGPKGYIDYPALVAYLDVAAPATTVYVAKACNVRFLHPRTSTLGRGRASCLKSLDSGHSHA